MINRIFPIRLLYDFQNLFEFLILWVLHQIEHGTFKGCKDCSLVFHPSQSNTPLPLPQTGDGINRQEHLIIKGFQI